MKRLYQIDVVYDNGVVETQEFVFLSKRAAQGMADAVTDGVGIVRVADSNKGERNEKQGK